MKAPNPLSPFLMTPAERRAELCRILARGLVRLRTRNRERNGGDHHAVTAAETRQPSAKTGELGLHYPADQRLHANPSERRPA